MRQQERKFEQREAVRGKDKKRIPQEFVRASAKMIQCPALPKYLRELRHPDKVIRTLEWIESDRHLPIARRNDNQLVAQVTVFRSLPCVDRPKNEWSEFAVDVEYEEPSIRRDVLLYQVAQQRTLASAGFSEDCDVHCATHVPERFVPLRCVTIRDPESEVEPIIFPPCSASPALEAVPESNKKVFEELFHDVKQCG
jgi:hypothetical protein